VSGFRGTGRERRFYFAGRKFVIHPVPIPGEQGAQEVPYEPAELSLWEVSSREGLKKDKLQGIEQSGQANPIVRASLPEHRGFRMGPFEPWD
jgi:hypothetical protein